MFTVIFAFICALFSWKVAMYAFNTNNRFGGWLNLVISAFNFAIGLHQLFKA